MEILIWGLLGVKKLHPSKYCMVYLTLVVNITSRGVRRREMQSKYEYFLFFITWLGWAKLSFFHRSLPGVPLIAIYVGISGGNANKGANLRTDFFSRCGEDKAENIWNCLGSMPWYFTLDICNCHSPSSKQIDQMCLNIWGSVQERHADWWKIQILTHVNLETCMFHWIHRLDLFEDLIRM